MNLFVENAEAEFLHPLQLSLSHCFRLAGSRFVSPWTASGRLQFAAVYCARLAQALLQVYGAVLVNEMTSLSLIDCVCSGALVAA